MKYSLYFFYYLIFSISLTPLIIKTQSARFPRLYSFLGGYSYETTDDQQYKIPTQKKLTVINNEGNITIETGHKGNIIYVKTAKKSKTEENLKKLILKHEFKAKDELALTVDAQGKGNGAVDLTLIIPAHLALDLTTLQGAITVNQVHGPICTKVGTGSIKLSHINKSIEAHIKTAGGITITDAGSVVNAITESGDITIENASGTIFAHTQRGVVTTTCNKVPETSKILLSSDRGAVNLHIPETVNAQLHAKTEKGNLFSDVYVTIKPQTTKLNQETYRRFKQEVYGLLGSGEAEIRLSCKNGNIKILERT